MKKSITLTIALVSALTSTAFAAPSTELRTAKPLKIYILAGQSNMQGKAALGTIPRMALNPNSNALHDKIVDKAGEPIAYKNVSIVYFTGGDEKKGEARPLAIEKGILKAGVTGLIGPELAFGITMNESVDQPILIIKTAWGGKSLYRHFRPPSAGLLPFETPKPKKNADPISEEKLAELKAEDAASQGVYYRLMIKLINEVLADPGKYSDAYDPEQGYEIAGFGWFQGFNDKIARKAEWYKPTEDKPEFAHHTELLAHLIRDLRKEFNAPDMPAVIGVYGIGGDNPDTKTLRDAQAAVADLPEFKGTVVAVPTVPFWDHELEEAAEKIEQAEALLGNSKDWTIVGTPEPKDRIWHYTSFNLDEEKLYKDKSSFNRTLTTETPEGLNDWLKPDFDTSTWQKGPAPVGKGVAPKLRKSAKRKKGRKAEEQPKEEKPEEDPSKLVRSTWGDGNVLLMKTTFMLNRDDIAKFRLCLRSTRSFNVYLNGEPIKHYAYWQGTEIRKWDIDESVVKKGKNELAFYGNIEEHKGTFFNAVDLYLEGLPKKTADKIAIQQNELAPPRMHEIAKGKSNQAYHYLGSAYTYCLIGEAMAKKLMSLKAGN